MRSPVDGSAAPRPGTADPPAGREAGAHESHARYPGWRVAAAAGIGVWFASLVVVTFPVLLKPWCEEFAWSRQAASVAFAIAAAVAGASAAPVGLLVDRVGAHRIAVPSLALLGCAFASLAWLTPRLWHLYAVFAVLGVAGIGTSPVAYARAISTWFSARRGLALALVITGGALGGILHPPVTAALSHVLGWRGACLALGALVLVVGVPVVARVVREHPESRAGAAPATGSALGEGLRARNFWVLVVTIFCGTMLQNSVIVHLSALLTDRGVSAGQGAIALSAMAAAAVVGRLVTGFVIDRVYAGRVLAALMAIAAAGAWLLADAQTFAAGVAAAMLVGFGTGGESDVVPFLLSRYFGLRSFSALYGFAWLANAVGGALGPVLMGRAFDTSGTYATILVPLALAVLGAAALALALPRDRSAPRVGESVTAKQ